MPTGRQKGSGSLPYALRAAVGVWASRSPFRPNPLGLSCVELLRIEDQDLIVKGADLMDGTPIYDIKPYVSYADAFPEAASGFASAAPESSLKVVIPETLPFTEEQRQTLRQVLSLDPRPAYQEDPDRVYGFPFAGFEVRFTVRDGRLTVREIGQA